MARECKLQDYRNIGIMAHIVCKHQTIHALVHFALIPFFKAFPYGVAFYHCTYYTTF